MQRTANSSSGAARQKPRDQSGSVSAEHYLRLILYRKWVILIVFLAVAAGAEFYAESQPNVYKSETVILVDPQKVPEAYVKSTVTGDIHNRLGLLAQQILSATQLQKIIDSLNLYGEERKKLSREDVIAKMRSDIATTAVSDFGGSQDLQAFRITYYGKQPQLVAQVANQLATLFINENYAAREQQASSTTDFLENQLKASRRDLEDQETKIRDFRIRHSREMPEQASSDLQVLGQVQAQLQLEGEALSRAESQKSQLEAMVTQAPPTVVDLDRPAPPAPVNEPKASKAVARPQTNPQLAADRNQLAFLRTKYGEAHPDVARLRKKIEQEEAVAAKAAPDRPAAPVPPPPPAVDASASQMANTPSLPALTPSVSHFNPVVQSQLKTVNAEIAKHKDEQERLSKLVAGYKQRVDAIPVTEQEMASLSRDYEMSKMHYSQLLDRELSAQTATQLELRQKGEKFEVLDPALPAMNPVRPNRMLIRAGGMVGGLVLGLLAILASELLGMAITDPQDVTDASGVPVLGTIPVILTHADRLRRRRRRIMAVASGAFALLAVASILLIKYHNRV